MISLKKPLLYSFRRCPYAIRARIALYYKEIEFDLREVNLRDKPADLLELSPKGTVPVLQLPGGRVIDESLAIVDYALDYKTDNAIETLIGQLHADFIPALNRFKYQDRYENVNVNSEKENLLLYMNALEERLLSSPYLFGDTLDKADIVILPFIRQLYKANSAWFDQAVSPEVGRWFFDFFNSELHFKVMS